MRGASDQVCLVEASLGADLGGNCILEQSRACGEAMCCRSKLKRAIVLGKKLYLRLFGM